MSQQPHLYTLENPSIFAPYNFEMARKAKEEKKECIRRFNF